MNSDSPKTVLNRSLKEGHVLMITIGTIIGAAFFIGSSPSIIQAGPLVIVAYAISVLFMVVFTKSLTSIMLSSRQTGSFITAVGQQSGHSFLTLVGWGYWMVWPLVMSSQMVAGGAFISHLLPVSTLPVALLLLAALLVVNLFSVDIFGRFQTALSIIKLGSIGIFVLLSGISLVYMYKLGLPFPVIHENFIDYLSNAPSWWKPMVAVIPTLFTTMAGIEVVSIAASESEGPLESLLAMMTKVAIWVGTIYSVCIFFVLCFVPWNQLDPAYSAFLPALHAINFPYAEGILAIIIFISILSTLNATLYISSRVLMELGQNEAAPKALGVLSKKNRLPIRAMLLSAALSVLLLLSTYSVGNGLIALLLSATGSFVIFTYLIIILSSMKTSYKNSKILFVGEVVTASFLAAILVSTFLIENSRAQALISAGALFVVWLLSVVFKKKQKSL